MGRSVRDVMTTPPVTLRQTQSCASAARLMRDKDIGAAVVTGADGEVCGMVTDRDIVIRCVADNRNPNTTALARVCSRGLVALSPEDDLRRAVEVMRSNALRRVPIVENGKPIGILSLGDLAVLEAPESALGRISQAPANH